MHTKCSFVNVKIGAMKRENAQQFLIIPCSCKMKRENEKMKFK